jgi:twinkle protein
MSDTSDFIGHTACPCGKSSDGLGHYTDGHTYCFVCQKSFPASDSEGSPAPVAAKRDKSLLPLGEFYPLEKRGITVETCRRWRYHCVKSGGKWVQVAEYYNPTGTEVVAQKVRADGKDFHVRGDLKEAGLFGQHLARGQRRIIITEGEIDALTISQVLAYKWPVVSIPNGASGAAKALSKALQWLLSFEEIVLCFDQDEPGRQASKECAALFPAGRVKIVSLPLKDPNDMLMARRVEELVAALWSPQPYRPDGIVTVADIRNKVLTAPERGLSWFIPELDDATFGRRLGECVALGAGTGIGKTDLITEQITHDLTVLKQSVAVIMLEQDPAETVKRIAGKMSNKRFHVPDGSWTQDDLVSAVDKLSGSGKLFLYNHFGAMDWPTIRETIRFLAHSEGVKLFYLDHLTALAAAEEDERRGLEIIMSEIGSLVKELGIWLLFVSHLATPEGKPHEEGGRVTIRHFKGSRAIGYWSVFMLGLERNQQVVSQRAVLRFVDQCADSGLLGFRVIGFVERENARPPRAFSGFWPAKRAGRT